MIDLPDQQHRSQESNEPQSRAENRLHDDVRESPTHQSTRPAPEEMAATLPVIRKGQFASIDAEEITPTGALLLVDKPLNWTSFDVVAKVRNGIGIRKVGHAGTLDPLATGLLLLCIGKGTRLAEHFQAERKEYTGTIRLGAVTPTEDAEGEEENVVPVDHLTEDEILAAAGSFLGESDQIPPMFSARKVGGKRLYKLARKGIEIERPAKRITIYSFDIESIDLPQITFRITCSKGTYIRSIARDMGERLGVGGYLSSLRRTQSGQFRVEEGVTVEEIVEAALQRRARREEAESESGGKNEHGEQDRNGE